MEVRKRKQKRFEAAVCRQEASPLLTCCSCLLVLLLGIRSSSSGKFGATGCRKKHKFMSWTLPARADVSMHVRKRTQKRFEVAVYRQEASSLLSFCCFLLVVDVVMEDNKAISCRKNTSSWVGHCQLELMCPCNPDHTMEKSMSIRGPKLWFYNKKLSCMLGLCLNVQENH